MEFNEEFCCPYCDSVIGENDFVFVRNGSVLGCENCIEHEVVHIPDEEELEAEYYDSLYDEMKMERMFGL